MKTLQQIRTNSTSQLMLGTVQFGMAYGIANTTGQPSYEQARDMIRLAFENGIDSLDTAATYGQSEELIGKALQELNLTNQVMVVTKIPAVPPGLSRSEIEGWVEKHLQASRRKLRTDVLPLVLFHREIDHEVAEEYLAKAVAAGEVLETGVSGGSFPTLMKNLIEQQDFQAVQIPLNMFDRRFTTQTGITKLATEKGMAIFTRSAYLQGLAVMPIERIAEKGEYFQVFVSIRKKLDKLADQSGMDICEMAMRYVLSIKGVTKLVVGVETADQLKQNVRIAQKGPLAHDQMQEIDAVIPQLPDQLLDPAKWAR